MSGAATEIFLNPGDFRFGAAPLKLATLLGSCVTVTLWQPRRRIGGMCHFMLPEHGRGKKSQSDGRFARDAFQLFDQALARTETLPEQYQAKLFGGGDMFPGNRFDFDIGAKNIAIARELLEQRGIPLVAEHVGGAGHRRLVFDLGSGEVRLLFSDLDKASADG